MNICKFCGAEWNSKLSLSSHQRFCKANPNPITYSYSKKNNQWTKARENGEEYKLTPETLAKISESSKGKKRSEAFKKNLSKIAVDRNLGGVRQSKRIPYKNKTLGSTYELKVANALDDNCIKWETGTRFKYVDPTGKERTYTPDFYLPDYNVYLDPKNDFLIENVNPSLGFKDIDKIDLVEKQNNVKVLVLPKEKLDWISILKLINAGLAQR